MNKEEKRQLKLLKLASLEATDKDLEIIETVQELEDSIDTRFSDLETGLSKKIDSGVLDISEQLKKNLLSLEEELVYEVDEEKIILNVLSKIPAPKDGKDYILTESDKKYIASSIKVPIVEKVIEKVEVIREQPIELIRREVKEVAVTDKPKVIADKLNTLTEAVDAKVIKGYRDLERNLKESNARLYTGVSETRVRELIALLASSSSSGGTVTSVSVVTANGLSGTVATSTTTPAITLDISGLDATKIANGSVTSTEFQYLDGVTSNIQTQIDSKGSGTVTSVSGTTDRITSTGGTTPVIDISATFEALLGKVANPLSQFASTTSAQLAGIISDETGTNKLVFSDSPVLISPALGTPTSITLTNAAGLPVLTGISGMGTNVADFLASPSSANLAAAVTGETGSGSLVFATGPTVTLATASTAVTQTPADNSTKLATTAYVDNAILGQRTKEAVGAATTATLVGVYLNGTLGVGATFTYTATGVQTIDGVTLVLGLRLLLKNQTSSFQNGLWSVTTAGAIGIAAILTRTSDFDQASDIQTGDTVFVTAGTTLANTTWTYNGIDNPVMGTDAITWAQAAGPGSFTAGNGITITGVSIAIDTAVTVDKTTAQTLTTKTLTSPIISNATASTIAIYDGSKVLGSADTATYPSLTELSYVKGVTSAIQTQLNAKEVTLTFSTGLTRTANTITNNLSTGVAGGQTAIGGTASGENLTLSSTSHATKGKIIFGTASAYDQLNDRLGVGQTGPANKLSMSSSTAFDGAYMNAGATNIATGFYAVGSGSNVSASMQSYGSTFATASLANLGGFSSSLGLVMITDSLVASGGSARWSVRTGGYNAVNERICIIAAGQIGIGQTSPTAKLEIAGSSAGAANTQSLILGSGVLLATLQNGSVENNGYSLFYTPDGAGSTRRKSLAMNYVTEVDFGLSAVDNQTFYIANDAITTSSYVVATIAFIAPTGRDVDEVMVETFDIKCGSTSGAFFLYMRSLYGTVTGMFKVNYSIGS